MSNYVLETSLVDGKMFLNASLHSAKRKRGRVGGGGGGHPPICTHSVFITGSETQRTRTWTRDQRTKGPDDQETTHPTRAWPSLEA